MRIVIQFIKISYAKMREYMADYIILFFNVMINFISIYVFWFFLLNMSLKLNGWSQQDLNIFIAILTLSQSIGEVFFGISNLPEEISTGKFDIILTKPINPYLFLIGKHLNIVYVVEKIVFSMALILFFSMLYKVNIQGISVFIALLFMFIGIVINQMFLLIIYSLSYWFTKINFLSQILFQFQDFLQYPLDFFSKAIRYTLTFIIPYGLTCYYPALIFLGKRISVEIMIIIYLLLFITFSILLKIVLKLGESRYDSNGG